MNFLEKKKKEEREESDLLWKRPPFWREKNSFYSAYFSRRGHCHHSRITMHRRQERAPAMPFYLESEITKAFGNEGEQQCKKAIFRRRPCYQVLPLESFDQPFHWKEVQNDTNNVPCGSRRSPEVSQRSLYRQPLRFCLYSPTEGHFLFSKYYLFWFCFFYKLRTFDIFAVPPNWLYENYFFLASILNPKISKISFPKIKSTLCNKSFKKFHNCFNFWFEGHHVHSKMAQCAVSKKIIKIDILDWGLTIFLMNPKTYLTKILMK